MDEIIHNLKRIRERIAAACERAGRNTSEVKLLLATKTVPAAKIKKILEAGELLIGENKVQELKEKFEELKNMPHEQHFIGHLQTNKIKDILKYNVSCIQSLDRLDLAEKLNSRLMAANKQMEVLIQVNTSAEASKFGVRPEEAIDLARQVSRLKAVQVKGLMTIGRFSSEPEKVRPCFRLLKSIQQEIIDLHIPHVIMQELSMGMSGDLETAVEEGATIVRVGTAIFGQRIHPDSYYWQELPYVGKEL